MKRSLVIGLALCLAIGIGGKAYANVFAAHLDVSGSINISASTTVTITYRLNEAADSGVEVQIIGPMDNMPQLVRVLDSSEPDPAHRPGSATGENSVVWDGNDDAGKPAYNGQYTYKVVASDDGYSSWTNITPMQTANPAQPIEALQPYHAKGWVCVTDQSDPNFGKILYCHSYDGTSTNPGDDNEQPNQDGVYRLYNDGTYLGGSRSTGYAAGNSALSGKTHLSYTSSPYRLKMGRDDGRLYLCDFVDGYENVWLGDTDWSTVTQLMESADAYGVGGTQNHGNMTGITATGTASNTNLFAIDEDLKWGDCALDPVIGFNVYRWNIGTTVSNYEAMPAELVISGTDPAITTGLVNNPDLEILPNGNIVVMSYRWDMNQLAVIVWDPVAGAPVWQKVGTDFSLVSGFGSGYFACCAYDPDKDLLYVMRQYGTLFGLDPDDGTEIFGSENIDMGSGGGYFGLDTDAAGNIIASSYGAEQTWIWSPPDGPNSFETTGIAKITVSGGADKPISTNASDWEVYH